MPHLIIVIASALTTVRTTWELSRLVRKRRDARILKNEVPFFYRILQQAYAEGRLREREYDFLLERLILAEANRDVPGLRKIQAAFRILLANPSPPNKRSARN